MKFIEIAKRAENASHQVIDVSTENGELIAHFKGTVYRKSENIDFNN